MFAEEAKNTILLDGSDKYCSFPIIALISQYAMFHFVLKNLVMYIRSK